ncbi:hypothetical protein [Zobellia alginiliquefaciens]|uniref:hypothetical protein n=1 Tax=Zobellia alginiliquefaciens TaxID=3032586 RepID=UPI0023E36E20|nr:hypothetical protein [Zobellia alginiliquefaciens]
MNISDFKNHKEYQKIIKKEKIPIGNFSYEIYLGSDILFQKKDDTGLWDITIYKRLEGTPLERLMIISALGTIKSKEENWYNDETSPFSIIGPEIQKSFHLIDDKCKKIAEEVLCDIRNSLHYMFEVDFLLRKNTSLLTM